MVHFSKKYLLFLLGIPVYFWLVKRFLFFLRKKRARFLVTLWKYRYHPFS